MTNLSEWRDATLAQRAVEALKKNRFTAAYFDDPQEALAHAAALVPSGASVGVGGSRTTRDLGLLPLLAEKNCVLLDHGREGISPEERKDTMYKQLRADVFISGCNAITLKGELVNRDAFGNRVAAMMFGPKTVIILAGANKIVADLDGAEKRIRSFAAPMNNKRYETPNPCTQLGECVDCNNPTRICNITTIISRKPPMTDIHVLLLGGRFGF